MHVLDGSGSMWGQVDGTNKIVTARIVISSLLADWGPEIALGLMSYGHRRKGDCRDIEVLISPRAGQEDDVAARIDAIDPNGKMPLSAAVRRAARELRNTENPATVQLVTDGLETCDTSPYRVTAELDAAGVDFTAHAIGFDIAAEDAGQVACIAKNSGRRFVRTANAAELVSALSAVVRDVEADKPDRVVAVLAPGEPPLDELDLDAGILDLGATDTEGETASVPMSTGRSIPRAPVRSSPRR